MSSGKALCFAALPIYLVLLASCGGITTTPIDPALAPLTATATDEPGGTPGGAVVIFAASSLTDAFRAMRGGLSSAGVDPSYNFSGSQALATQLALGAKADVFASADLQSVNTAIASGAVVSGTERVLATNRLVVVVPAGNGGKVAALRDLANPGVKLDLAGPSVPAGSYSLQALDKLSGDARYGADFKQKVLDNVVSREDNVRQVLAKVQVGEADAGIVYTTDAAVPGAPASGSQVRIIEIPEQYNIIARYYIAPIENAQHRQSAQRFIRYALSDAGQAQLEKYGFGRGSSTK